MKFLPEKDNDFKKIFEDKLKNCKSDKLSHISNELNIENMKDRKKLKELDRKYGVANEISGKNQSKHINILRELSTFGSILVVAFLVYDAISYHSFIALCLIMIVLLFNSRWWANNSLFHKKYLEFRILAESFRLQFFLSVAGVKKPVVEILPWFVKEGIPWITDVLYELDLPDVGKNEKVDILNFWIRNQISYHDYKIRKTQKEKETSVRVTKLIRGATIGLYVIALIFEASSLAFSSFIGMEAEAFRTCMILVLGFMSAVTIFVDSYYGKKSLDDVIDDSSRMKELYIEIEQKVMHEGESEEILVDLAREYLIENSIWYAYQNQNKPDLVM